ncbi:MAG: bifunctional aldolase/short-chain dehydrogenase [Rhodospirillaceae bacterium]|nr:bifunctional aldolase/short-chain dehydrogenase [Rhodospirillaceae bacterium]
MENLWSQKEAEELAKYYKAQGVGRDIAMRVYSSRLLGGVSDLVLHGGGNVSVKTREEDFLGQTVEVLRIKGSGWNMDTIEPDGLPAVRLKPLQDSVALDNLSDFEMVNLHRTSLMDSSAPNPSVETLLHAFLPHKFVDHTHSNAILALTDQVNGAQICQEIFGSRVAIVPYIMPGFHLARSALDVFRASPASEGLILLKHGIFTFGETAEESYNRMIELVTLAEFNIPDSAVPNVQPVADSVPSHDLGPVIRGKCVVSGQGDGEAYPFVVSFRTSAAIRSYSMSREASRLVMSGPVTPDHVIRTKPWPLLVDPPKIDELSNWADYFGKKLQDYENHYHDYFARNNSKEQTSKIALDPLPRVILVKDIGLFALGKDLRTAKIVADIAETNVRVVSDAERVGKFESISEKEIFDIEYWPLEQAKLGGVPRSKLSGKVVVVTGAAGAIGKAIAEAFHGEGAEVILLDFSEEGLKSTAEFMGGHPICCDVTNPEEVAAAFKQIKSLCGGVDILVSNAGIALEGRIGDVPDEVLRRSFEVNFFAHQNVASRAVEIMRTQGMGGVLLFNVSKQAVNPGKNFGPYGLPKSATMFLSRQYALDYGGDGIRSNAVNADRIRSGIMTAEMIASRAQSRGQDVEQYMSSNLLGQEVGAEHVAKAFVDLALSPRTTGAVLTVDGGNIAAALR